MGGVSDYVMSLNIEVESKVSHCSYQAEQISSAKERRLVVVFGPLNSLPAAMCATKIINEPVANTV